jgi:Flp pilus assembly protein TadD
MRIEEARELLELALEHDPQQARAAAYLAQVHLLRDPEDGWKQALRYARIATRNAPAELTGYKLQARAAFHGKWREEFKSALEHAYAIAPDDPELHELQAGFFFDEGKTEMALVEIERAIEHDPDSATAHRLLARILRSQQRWAEARNALRTAVRLGGNYKGALKDLTALGLDVLIHSSRK